jgi:hypothetical protein
MGLYVQFVVKEETDNGKRCMEKSMGEEKIWEKL